MPEKHLVEVIDNRMIFMEQSLLVYASPNAIGGNVRTRFYLDEFIVLPAKCLILRKMSQQTAVRLITQIADKDKTAVQTPSATRSSTVASSVNVQTKRSSSKQLINQNQRQLIPLTMGDCKNLH
jgi:hypothetical protein